MFRISNAQLCSSLLFLTSSFAIAQTSSNVTELKLKTPIERTIASGDVHTYNIKLTQGQILRLVANQRGVDVVVRAFAPDGTKMGDFDSPTGTEGSETVNLFAELAGVYRLEITPFTALGGGRYDITIEEIRAATKSEMERHKVEKQLLTQLEQPWDEANRLIDTVQLERLMAVDYLNYSVTNRGANQDKQTFLSEASRRKSASSNVISHHETDDVTLRVYGDAAMATGRVVITANQNGREQKFPGRFVHLWLLRGGRWQIAGDMFFPANPLPIARTAVKLDPQIYEPYVGKYELDGLTQLTFTKAGDNLLLQIGESQDTLYPESDSEFFSKSADVQFTFVRNARGEVTHLIMTENGRASKGVKAR